MDKNKVFDQITGVLSNKLESITKAEESAQQTANEAEGAMQTRYGSTKEEAQELKNGYSVQRMYLEQNILELNKNKSNWIVKKSIISLGSLCEVKFKEQTAYFLLLSFGGISVPLEDKKIFILSPETPLAKLLNGQKENGEFSFNGNIYKIIEIYGLLITSVFLTDVISFNLKGKYVEDTLIDILIS